MNDEAGVGLLQVMAGQTHSVRRAPLRVLICGATSQATSPLVAALMDEAKRLHGQPGPDNVVVDEGVARPRLFAGLETSSAGIHTCAIAPHLLGTPQRAIVITELVARAGDVRSIAIAAANSDLAVICVDAAAVTAPAPQTIEKAYTCFLFGIRHVVLAVDANAAGELDQATLDGIAHAFANSAEWIGLKSITCIPVAGRQSPNQAAAAGALSWYRGPTLLAHIEAFEEPATPHANAFRFPVLDVDLKSAERALSGVIVSGDIRVGEEVVSAVSGRQSRVARIVASGREVPVAHNGDAVVIGLAEAIDVARGDLIARVTERPEVSNQFAAHLLWLDDHLLQGRSYVMRIGARLIPASITTIKHRVDLANGQHLAARQLNANEIGMCNISTAMPFAFDAFADNREAGSFALIDRISNATVAIGLISFGLRRATNIHVEELFVDKEARSAAKHQKPTAIWFTGLSGSGKSTIAKRLEKRLHDLGNHTYVLDGDNVRHGLNQDLGFTDADRVENIRRIGEVAKLFVDCGLIVMCSFISPFRAERNMVRELLDKDEFVEVFVDASIEECKRRDPKGLYAKALAGKVKNFTGIDSPYEPPERAEIHLVTEDVDPEALVDQILGYLRVRGRI